MQLESPTLLEELSKKWLELKQVENEAQKERLAIEAELVNVLGAKEEGAKTHNAGTFKVTVTGKLTYKADMEQLEALLANISPNLHPIKVERKLDEKGVKYLKNNEPEIFNQIAPAITIAPAKTAISIKQEAN